MTELKEKVMQLFFWAKETGRGGRASDEESARVMEV